MDTCTNAFTTVSSTFSLISLILGITVSPVFFGLALVGLGVSAFSRSKSIGSIGIALGIAATLTWCGAHLGEQAAHRDNAITSIKARA